MENKPKRKRERIRVDIVASSDMRRVNIHRKDLKRNHEQNKAFFAHVAATVTITKYYVQCFGQRMEITKAEADRLGKGIVIVETY